MISINAHLQSPWSTSATGSPGEAATRWAGRAWAQLTGLLRIGQRTDRMLELNDHLLDDIGVTRANLQYDAAFWPIWRRHPRT